MIARTRPYLDPLFIKDFLISYKQKCFTNKKKDGNFYLNSGQACLESLLKCFEGRCNVGVQVFTCPTVLSAIVKAGHNPVFLDINKDYFTTTIDNILERIKDIDILIVTHVFGIPNPDYLKIKELCDKNNIVVIDDLCQTFHAKIGGRYIEDLSENYFYSFFYDKPISCASGGMLHVSEVYYPKVKKIIETYKTESDKDGINNIKGLANTQQLLAPDIYKHEFRNGNIMERLLITKYPIDWSISLLYNILASPFNKISGHILPRYDYSSTIKIMSNIQVSFINKLFGLYKNKTASLNEYFRKYSLPRPIYLCNDNIECSCSQRAIIRKNEVLLEGAEIALYNWPKLLDAKGDYPNAQYVIDNYVNIPILE